MPPTEGGAKQESPSAAPSEGLTPPKSVDESFPGSYGADETGRQKDAKGEVFSEENSPVEQVALTVAITDDPSLPVWTFRMWTLGLLSCALLSFINQFFSYQREPLTVSVIAAQIVVLPLGQFMAAVLPKGTWLNPGPFNLKEHVLITIFANAGTAFGSGCAYAIDVVTIQKAFYKQTVSFAASALLVTTTQVLGYGWAGLARKYLVEPANMWWPDVLVSVSLFRTLHEAEPPHLPSRFSFFLTVASLSFAYYVIPGYLFNVATCLSVACYVWPRSVTAQQVGSGLYGLGLGAVGLDWTAAAAYLGSPLSTPFFAVANVFAGFLIFMYIIMPLCYWGNVYNAKTYPIFSSDLYLANGSDYDITAIMDTTTMTLDVAEYDAYGKIHMSTFFALVYGIGFAALAATITHTILWNGREVWERSKLAAGEKPDVHTRMMAVYEAVPDWWFYGLGAAALLLSIYVCEGWKSELQLPWWGLLLAAALACSFTLPIGILAATTNQVPGLNIITEYLMGLLLPGEPIAVVTFKTYGYISMAQALSFLQDFKLGHYMKIPPRSMFIVQIVGTIASALINLIVAWYQLTTIPNICDTDALPASSPWTCPSARVFFNASVIWGLVGPRRVFGPEGIYGAMNWGFLIGALAPLPFWALYKVFPRQEWLSKVSTPILIGGVGAMPPATAVNYTSWFAVGAFFNYYVYNKHKAWWQRYNYVLSAALDTGVAFMAVLIFALVSATDLSPSWWGNDVDNCPLASCPTAPGVNVGYPCPVF